MVGTAQTCHTRISSGRGKILPAGLEQGRSGFQYRVWTSSRGGAMSEKKFINPPGLKPLGMYSNVACARGGTVVFISGQVAVDAQGRVVGKGNMEAQAAQVFENLKLALEAAGATFQDVLKLTIFIRDLSPEARKAVMNVRSRYISHTRPPAATMIGIDRLVEDDLMLEIEAVAMVDDK